MGVAVNYGQIMNENTLAFVKHHFNSITMGNEMKIDNMLGTKQTLTLEEAEKLGYVISDDYKACTDNKDADGNVIVPKISFTQTDQVLKQAKENGLQVRVHSPFWHSQMPQHFLTKNFTDYSDLPGSPSDFPERYTDEETMYTREAMYVQTLLRHIIDGGYEDTVSSFDVVNEYLHMVFLPLDKYRNFWQCIFGDKSLNSPYVKKAFVAAHEYLEKQGKRDKISLIYNDFNTYDEVDEVIKLINNMNAKDDMNPTGAKVCDGIGMQSHVGADTGAAKYENAIEAFHAAKFEIQITELDVNCGTVTGESTAEEKAEVWETNAKKYGEIMDVILRQKVKGANIMQVTVWGITDASSWMQDSAPLLFGATVADKKPSFDAFVNAALNFKK
jgi:GH35 family endo-1,4-beta-xylanase